MYRIRIFSSFCKSEICKEIYERLCESNSLDFYGENKNVYLTNEDDYTHVIILNVAMPNIPYHIPKQNVIGFACEPIVFLGLTNEFVAYAQNKVGRYYIGDKGALPDPFVERYSHMWHNPPLKYIPLKNKVMSMMVSEKAHEKGHIYRHQLINKILETDMPIDIYGRGCACYNYLGDERVKGKFVELEPYETYDFHICIENCESNHYFSEKITNTLLCGTTPIYMGCRNINSYFPDSAIVLCGNLSEDIQLLKDITTNPEKYKKKIDVDYVKDKVSLLKNVENLFQ
jgi:hypothetical protein